MGASHSTVCSDPRTFATAISSVRDVEEGGKSWQTYDYVIIGGGSLGIWDTFPVVRAVYQPYLYHFLTQGLPVASLPHVFRKTEEYPCSSSRPEKDATSHEGVLNAKFPYGFPRLFKSGYDWNYETLSMPAIDGRASYWPRGKMLGGTSYFRKAEGYSPHPDYPQVNSALHGLNGPFSTSHAPHASITEDIILSCVNVGIPRVYDFNTDAGPLGVAHLVSTISPKGERTSAATAYLSSSVRARPNLTVAVESMVEKIILSTEGNTIRAKGVILSPSRFGPLFYVAASKEVLVCAGTVATPQLLMLSGIGRADDLKKHGIAVVRDLPVGQGLQDHFSPGPLFLRAKPGTTWDHILHPFGGLVAFVKWLMTGKGSFATLTTQVAFFVRSDNRSLPMHDGENKIPVLDLSSGPDSPDIEVVFAPFLAPPQGKPPLPYTGITCGAIVLKPASYGSVTLSSASAWDHPVIDPNYLGNGSDMALCIKATRLMLRIARTKPFSDRLNLPKDSGDTSAMFWPGDGDPDKVTDEQIEAWIRRNGQSTWHPTSSARMGDSATNSVVDEQLRVHGVEGLRVVDASVFPTQVSGHPCSIVIAVAERAADLIKGEL
ncbi:hypothetical protein EW146_g7932 [Bondarzewia mesenterica]|uniref:Glucose-methanol-choline oxidoreductase N-terminal domain-containing protein n=1 Tax=Bondarzewia mesenterica TaxID=1095465 RepID=A0A4S4LII9_9AGAM|nr:hypothetical protein EW146_g7932 [Bondarzewia mesenterica]